ncbi:hypothetical protein AAF712_008101 [Marasmius tenuissimus]|uniref:Uncharacterized protein n=1 Tax=Marasmius tenuissimus TaxID=585030 RepID=A0ABR2ZXG4_9AGAR
MYESDRQENRNHSSPGAGGLRLSTPPLGTGSAANGTAVIDPALEGETGGSGARSGEAVPPKLRRSPAPPQAAVRRAKENDYSPVEMMNPGDQVLETKNLAVTMVHTTNQAITTLQCTLDILSIITDMRLFLT